MFLIPFLILVAICIIFIWFLRIYINVHFYWRDKEQKLHISVIFVKLKIIQRDIPLRNQSDFDWTDKLDENFELRFDSFMKTTKYVIEALQTIMSKTKLHELNWSTFVGTGEASSTGIASGILWSLKGTIVGYFLEKLILRCHPMIEVNPRFQDTCFQTDLNCMISIRIGKAIQGFIKLTRIMKAK